MWVAYNSWGDLIAAGYSYWEVIEAAEDHGYSELDLIVGKVTP